MKTISIKKSRTLYFHSSILYYIKSLFFLAALLIPLISANVFASAAPVNPCAAGTFAGLSVPVTDPDATTVTSIQLTGTANNIIPANDPSGVSLVTSPTLGTYCRVTGVINTKDVSQVPLNPGDNTSKVQFEVRLPTVWNNNYLQYGGGNTDGNFAGQGVPGFFWTSTLPNSPGSATYSPNGGYAISVTDSGHFGTGAAAFVNSDGTQNKDIYINFAYRSRHLLAIVAKEIIADYYGPAALKYSFHGGVSTGGRNSLIEAVRYPTDFDAIIAAAPASGSGGSRLQSAKATQAQFPGVTPAGCDASHLSICLASQVIPTAGPTNMMPTIANATMSKCDPEDGLVDGILSDPNNCDFDSLTDLNLNSMTAQQRGVLNTIYTDTVYPTVGNVVYPRFLPGYEDNNSFGGGFTMAGFFLGVGTPPLSAPASYSNGGQYFVYNPNYIPNIYAQGINLNLYASDFINPTSCTGAPGFGSPCSLFDPELIWNSATDTNLSAFKARGGKLIIIHGLADKSVSPLVAVRYYNDLIANMGDLNNTRDFARLFLVPGRAHGTSTLQAGVQNGIPAPANVGLSGGGANTGWMRAIEDWVATSVPPDFLLGTDTFTPPAQPTITRPICAYPFKAVYTGPGGNTAAMKVASNFQCRFYDLKGLFSPVDNLPVLNEVKAGQAIPVKFSLGRDWGLNIMAVGFPKSEVIACNATVSVNGVDETVTADESGLEYDSSSDQYKYVWKTNKSWKDSCRQLVIRLNEGTTVRANFTFK